MADFTRITIPQRKPGSYRRCDFAGDIIYPYLRFGDLRLSFYRNDDPADKLFDRTAEAMCEGGLISPDALLAYAAPWVWPSPSLTQQKRTGWTVFTAPFCGSVGRCWGPMP